MYRAKSLNDVAKLFRDRAKLAEDSMNRCLDRNQRNHYAGQVGAFNQCATIVENLEIEE